MCGSSDQYIGRIYEYRDRQHNKETKFGPSSLIHCINKRKQDFKKVSFC